jgi:hypothetical protein
MRKVVPPVLERPVDRDEVRRGDVGVQWVRVRVDTPRKPCGGASGADAAGRRGQAWEGPGQRYWGARGEAMAAGGRRVVPAASQLALANVPAVVVAVFVVCVDDVVVAVVVTHSRHYDFGNLQGQEAIGGGGPIPCEFGRGHRGRRSQDEIVVAPGPGGTDGRRPRSRPPRGGVLDCPRRPRAVRGVLPHLRPRGPPPLLVVAIHSRAYC